MVQGIDILRPDATFNKIAVADYMQLEDSVKLAATFRHSQLLRMQTVPGHAINRDGLFMDENRYPNATVMDVIRAISEAFPGSSTVDEVKRERMGPIKELQEWVIAMINEDYGIYSPQRLQDRRYEPLMGIRLFSDTSIHSVRKVLQGIYLGAYLDSAEWRAKTELEYKAIYPKLDIHQGICTAGNLEKIISAGLTISDLSSTSAIGWNGFDYQKMLSEGIVFDFSADKHMKNCGVQNNGEFVPVFVELKKGFGVSDDAAFIYLSLMYGIEAGFGFIMIDAVDTLDKCVPNIREGGEDEHIARLIERQYTNKYSPLKKNTAGTCSVPQIITEKLGIGDKDVMNLIFASAVDAENPRKWPSCSQRRFLQISNGNYALLSHIGLIKHIKDGSPYPEPLRIGFKKVSNDTFYRELRDRIRFMLENSFIDESRRFKMEKNYKNYKYLLNGDG